MKILSFNIVLLLLFYHFSNAQQRYQVVIDELYPDPVPSYGLPEAEYLELYNCGSQPANLTHWTISDNQSIAVLPADTLLPGHYLIICGIPNAQKFTTYGKVIGVSHFPSLNNAGDEIILRNNNGEIMHAVAYNTDWYKDDNKANGGYSLEMIDPDIACSGSIDWQASTAASGGTPGRMNAVNEKANDDQALDIIGAAIINTSEIQISFSKTLDSTSAVKTARYKVNNNRKVIKAVAEPPLFKKVDLVLDNTIDTNLIYQLTVNNIYSCSGRMIGFNNTARFGSPKRIQAKDIILNELLFNPRSGGNDFVEIYNRSNKILDLKNLLIARRYNGVIEQKQAVSLSSRLFFPGDYMVVTENARKVQGQYYCKNSTAFAEIENMPSLPNSAGDVVLLNLNGDIIDEFAYSENDQNALVNNAVGISLERINPEAATQNPSNWQSASADVGFATPTYKNSQFLKDTSFRGGFTFSSTIISPDNDGRDDKLLMHYEFPSTGFIANITIYNSNGFLIRRLYKNSLLGTKGNLKWDGYGENHKPLTTGIYIMLIKIFNLNGEQQQWKKAITIARKF